MKDRYLRVLVLALQIVVSGAGVASYAQSDVLEFLNVTPFDGLLLNIPGRYFLNSGEFRLRDLNGDNSIIKITSSNVELICNETVLIGQEDHTFATEYFVTAVSAENVNNVLVEGCEFRNFRTGLSFGKQVSDITIRNNRFFDNSEAAINVYDDQLGVDFPLSADNVRIDEITIDSNLIVGNTEIPILDRFGRKTPCYYWEFDQANCTGMFGVFLSGVKNTKVVNNEIRNATASAIRPDLTTNSLFEGNILETSALGIWAYAFGDFIGSGNIYRNNQIRNSLVGIGIGQNQFKTTVEGNEVSEDAVGIMLLPSSLVASPFGQHQTVVRENRVHDAPRVGITVISSQTEGSASDVFRAEIVNNEVYHNGDENSPFGEQGTGLGGNAGIRIRATASSNILLRGNKIFENVGNGIVLQNWDTRGENGKVRVVLNAKADVRIEMEENSVFDNKLWGIKTFLPACEVEWPEKVILSSYFDLLATEIEDWQLITDETFNWAVDLVNNEISNNQLGNICLPG